ncbi:MAG TPA: hypothetical protein VN914_04285, partial [Polyangia bacterium]|nr:hypothetical protein [Polyangia bacterium]
MRTARLGMVLFASLGALFTACGGSTSPGRSSADASDSRGPSGDRPSTSGSGTTLPPGGLLTAGAWDDNLNFDFFLKYLAKSQGLAGRPSIPVADRLTVLVQDSAAKLMAGATVIVSQNERELVRLQTGADGRALVFPTWYGASASADLTISAESGDGRGTTTVHPGDATATVSVTSARPTLAGLDVALIVDTTGSMGDEIRYLQAETLAISSAIATTYPNLSQRWAVVPYRDYGDAYVTRPIDFTDNLSAYQSSLRDLAADGGGDYPEAPELGVNDTTRLAWRSGPVARVAFWIADAPHHTEHAANMVAAIQNAMAKGIHLYPIAASSADDLTELTMRLSALVTGGRYLFLTNDSGIGNDHKEPRIPCYLVTSLQKAMLRMISMEVTGTRVDPIPTDVLRTGGNP